MPNHTDLAAQPWFVNDNGDSHNGYDFLNPADPGEHVDAIDVLRDGGPAHIERNQVEGALSSESYTLTIPVNTVQPFQVLGHDLTRRSATIKYAFSDDNRLGVVVGNRVTLDRAISGTLRDGYILLMGDELEVAHTQEVYVNTWQLIAPAAGAQLYVSVLVQRNHA